MKTILNLTVMMILCFASMGHADPMCFNQAGIKYNISPVILKAISKVESNHKSTAVSSNKNGSTDNGHMQINTFWNKFLKEDYNKLSDPCFSTHVGAWVLKQCIDRFGYGWDAVACYHTGSLSTPKKRALGKKYVRKVKQAVLDLTS